MIASEAEDTDIERVCDDAAVDSCVYSLPLSVYSDSENIALVDASLKELEAVRLDSSALVVTSEELSATEGRV